MRKRRLAYLKLSEAAAQRLQRAFVMWIEGSPMTYDFSRDTLEIRMSDS